MHKGLSTSTINLESDQNILPAIKYVLKDRSPVINHGLRTYGYMCRVLFSNQIKLSIFGVKLQNERAI